MSVRATSKWRNGRDNFIVRGWPSLRIHRRYGTKSFRNGGCRILHGDLVFLDKKNPLAFLGLDLVVDGQCDVLLSQEGIAMRTNAAAPTEIRRDGRLIAKSDKMEPFYRKPPCRSNSVYASNIQHLFPRYRLRRNCTLCSG